MKLIISGLQGQIEMEDFPEIRLPSFQTAPETKLQVTEAPASKDGIQQAKSSSDIESPHYYQDPSGDMNFFKFSKHSNVPMYRPASCGVLGAAVDNGVKVEEKVLLSALPTAALNIHSKAVQKALSRTVMEDADRNIHLLDYPDSKIANIYDPTLVQKDEERLAGTALERDQHDIDAWIRLSRVEHPELSVLAGMERRQLILEKAISSNPGDLKLIMEYVQVYGDSHAGKDTLELLRKLALKHPGLMADYFNYRICDHRTFSLFEILEEFGQFDNMQLVSLMFHAGYTERAIGILEYLCVVHYKKISPSPWLYKNGMLSYDAVPVEIDYAIPTVHTDAAAITEWLGLESYRSFKFSCPVQLSYADDQEEDPDRIVVFEDVSMFTFRPTLDAIFQLFGFDAQPASPFILIDYACYDFARKVEAINSLPIDLIFILKGICEDVLKEEHSLAASFHYSLLSNGESESETSSGYILYLICMRKFEDALVCCQNVADKSDQILRWEVELMMRLGAPNIDAFVLSHTEPLYLYHVFINVGAQALIKQLEHNSCNDSSIFSLLMFKLDTLHLPIIRKWLRENCYKSRHAFDAFIQFERRYSEGHGLRRIGNLFFDDYRVFVAVYLQLKIFRSQDFSTPFRAIQTVLQSSDSQVCLVNSLKAINAHPSVKQVYMAGIDRLCAYSEYTTALRILSAMEERGLRCRTLLEELLN